MGQGKGRGPGAFQAVVDGGWESCRVFLQDGVLHFEWVEYAEFAGAGRVAKFFFGKRLGENVRIMGLGEEVQFASVGRWRGWLGEIFVTFAGLLRLSGGY